jgi:mono/diheme cytochrome c family protein
MQFNRPSYLIILFFLISFYFACKSSSGNGSNESPLDDQLNGQKIYKKHCINCHGYDGDMGAHGAFNLQHSTLSFDEKKMVVLKGRNAMTPFEKVLTEPEIDAVVTYIAQFLKKEEQ